METEQREAGEAPTRSVAGNVIRGSLGNLIEWYDWYAYAAFSIYFASVFFPSGNQTAQLLNTAGIFAVVVGGLRNNAAANTSTILGGQTRTLNDNTGTIPAIAPLPLARRQ